MQTERRQRLLPMRKRRGLRAAFLVKGGFLYNLACFYAQQNQLEDAATRLREAVTYNPRLQEHAQSDPDLAALRDLSA